MGVIPGALSTSGIPNQSAMLDIAYPVGSVLTYPSVAVASAVSGSTMPEIGASGGTFLAFDKASTEACCFAIGALIPDTWRTVDLYVEGWNLGDADGGDVVWRISVNGGANADTTVTYGAQGTSAVSKLGGQTYTLGTATVASVTKYRAGVVLSRIGGDAADTLDADINLAALYAVRVT